MKRRGTGYLIAFENNFAHTGSCFMVQYGFTICHPLGYNNSLDCVHSQDKVLIFFNDYLVLHNNKKRNENGENMTSKNNFTRCPYL